MKCNSKALVLLVFVVSYRGDALYRFSIDSEWLTMPVMRGYDCLGACAQYMSLPGEGDNASGWYSYRIEKDLTGKIVESNVRFNIPSENFSRPTTHGWNGVAGTFNLPNDALDYYRAHYDFKAHAQFDIKVASPDISWNIDPRATYSHYTLGLDINMGAKISTDGAGAEIGLDVIIASENRTIRLPDGLYYTPND